MKKSDFILYDYASDKPMMVAVAREYGPKINHALSQFGSFEDVAHDWEVRGILIELLPGKTPNFDPDTEQIEVVLSNLRHRET